MGGRGLPAQFNKQSNEERKEERDRAKYKDFNDKPYIEDYESKHFKEAVDEWLGKTTNEEQNAVSIYTGSSYRNINDYLRSDKFGTNQNEPMENLIKQITSGLSKFKVKDNLSMYRKSGDDLFSELGVRFDGSLEKFVSDINSFKNSVVRDKGFTSTSTRRSMWDGKVWFEIQVPKGTNGAYVDRISRNDGERELLLNRGTRFKIIGARVGEGSGFWEKNVPIVTLRVIK